MRAFDRAVEQVDELGAAFTLSRHFFRFFTFDLDLLQYVVYGIEYVGRGNMRALARDLICEQRLHGSKDVVPVRKTQDRNEEPESVVAVLACHKRPAGIVVDAGRAVARPRIQFFDLPLRAARSGLIHKGIHVSQRGVVFPFCQYDHHARIKNGGFARVNVRDGRRYAQVLEIRIGLKQLACDRLQGNQTCAEHENHDPCQYFFHFEKTSLCFLLFLTHFIELFRLLLADKEHDQPDHHEGDEQHGGHDADIRQLRLKPAQQQRDRDIDRLDDAEMDGGRGGKRQVCLIVKRHTAHARHSDQHGKQRLQNDRRRGAAEPPGKVLRIEGTPAGQRDDQQSDQIAEYRAGKRADQKPSPELLFRSHFASPPFR